MGFPNFATNKDLDFTKTVRLRGEKGTNRSGTVHAMTKHGSYPANRMKAKLVGILAFDGVTALDITGACEVLTAATTKDASGNQEQCYETLIVGVGGKTVVSETGVVFKAHKTLPTAPAFDTIIIPGGRGLREPETNRAVSKWLGRAGFFNAAFRFGLHRHLWTRPERTSRRPQRHYPLALCSRCGASLSATAHELTRRRS